MNIRHFMDETVPDYLAHRAEPKVRVSEKWIRFSASRDAPPKEKSIGWISKAVSTFGSDALESRRPCEIRLVPRAAIEACAMALPLSTNWTSGLEFNRKHLAMSAFHATGREG